MNERTDTKAGGGAAILSRILLALHVVSAGAFAALAAASGFLPGRFLAIVIGVLAATVLLTLPFHLGKTGGSKIGGAVLSLILTAMFAFGSFYLWTISHAVDTIARDVTESDSYVVVVRADDPAQTIVDAASYEFALPLSGDSDGLAAALEDISAAAGGELATKAYAGPMEEANALLAEEIPAAIYNEAYTATLEEAIENYSDQVRILYRAVIEKEPDEPERTVSVDEPFTVYISGIDVAGAITTTSRSDVNIIVNVNPYTHKILLTTTPRDYFVTIPGISGDVRDKLTHAGIYGIRASMATLENVYGVDLDYYVRVNFTSLINIVDALGGIDVDSPVAFTKGDYSFVQGVNHMDGEMALAFCRERYAFASGDNQRGKNQEAVLTAIIHKITSPAVLTHAGEVIEVVSSCTQTSISREDISKLVSRQLAEGASWQVESQAASGTGDSQPTYSMGETNLYVMWPDEEVVASLAEKMKAVLEER